MHLQIHGKYDLQMSGAGIAAEVQFSSWTNFASGPEAQVPGPSRQGSSDWPCSLSATGAFSVQSHVIFCETILPGQHNFQHHLAPDWLRRGSKQVQWHAKATVVVLR